MFTGCFLSYFGTTSLADSFRLLLWNTFMEAFFSHIFFLVSPLLYERITKVPSLLAPLIKSTAEEIYRVLIDEFFFCYTIHILFFHFYLFFCIFFGCRQGKSCVCVVREDILLLPLFLSFLLPFFSIFFINGYHKKKKCQGCPSV